MRYRLHCFFWLSLCGWLAFMMPGTACKGNTRPLLVSGEPVIKVLLTHASGKNPALVATTGAYQICDGQNQILYKGERLSPQKLQIQGGIVCAGPYRATDKLWIKTVGDSFLEVNRVRYYGDIFCVIQNSKELQVVNVLPMEKYVGCVLGAEMPLSWPQAALQTQAIIARSYALYEKCSRKERDFDVYDTVLSQVYPGIPGETPYARAIVRSTTGDVLLYQNGLFKAFFHSTCGGHTANALDAFTTPMPDITPLMGRPCPFCEGSKYFNWQFHADIADLEMLLNQFKLPPPLIGLAPGKKDKGGRILNLEIHHGDQQKKSISASQLRKALGEEKLRSTLFEMKAAADGIVFEGRGWGHGVGLCQVGAAGMAERGFSAVQILEFYYPGTNLYQLWK